MSESENEETPRGAANNKIRNLSWKTQQGRRKMEGDAIHHFAFWVIRVL